MYAAYPIIRNSAVHTTGNTQLGGESGGRFITAYFSDMLPESRADSPPTASGMASEISNRLRLKTATFINFTPFRISYGKFMSQSRKIFVGVRLKHKNKKHLHYAGAFLWLKASRYSDFLLLYHKTGRLPFLVGTQVVPVECCLCFG